MRLEGRRRVDLGFQGHRMNGMIHPGDRMTSRERLLAAYSGQELDRLPWWAKVTNSTWRTSQPERICAWSDVELLDYIHADGLFGCPGVVRVVRPHITAETHTVENGRQTVTHTPDGDMVERWALDPYTNSWHPVEFPIKTIEDVHRYRWFFRDVRLEVLQENVSRGRSLREHIGQRGVLLGYWGTSPLMDLVEHVIGPVHTHLMLADHPAEMEELIRLMHQHNLRIVQLFGEHSPADFVVSVENTSTTLISPEQFERYCYRHLCEYGRAIESAGKRHELHMCGHTKALLGRIDTIPAASIEAFTSPTLGNTRLVDGRTRAPSKTLVGGTNVMVWLKPIDQIQRYITEELAACPNHRRIVLTTAGVAPPACSAETFRAIGEWIRTLPVRM
jgi:uroporphyrinogen-III decarboxylase